MWGGWGYVWGLAYCSLSCLFVFVFFPALLCSDVRLLEFRIVESTSLGVVKISSQPMDSSGRNRLLLILFCHTARSPFSSFMTGC